MKYVSTILVAAAVAALSGTGLALAAGDGVCSATACDSAPGGFTYNKTGEAAGPTIQGSINIANEKSGGMASGLNQSNFYTEQASVVETYTLEQNQTGNTYNGQGFDAIVQDDPEPTGDVTIGDHFLN